MSASINLRGRVQRLETQRQFMCGRAEALRRARVRRQEMTPLQQAEAHCQWVEKATAALSAPDLDGAAGRLQRARRRAALSHADAMAALEEVEVAGVTPDAEGAALRLSQRQQQAREHLAAVALVQRARGDAAPI